MLKEWLKKIFYKLVLQERSAQKLTISFCVGNFIAWLPIIPFQTPLIFVFSWIFRLNTTVTFTAVYVVNNPITIIPIYIIDYMFGNIFFQKILGIDVARFNPSWVDRFSNYIGKYVNLTPYLGGTVFCFWCLILGGLVLATILSIILYFIMLPVFKRMQKKLDHLSTEYENSSAK